MFGRKLIVGVNHIGNLEECLAAQRVLDATKPRRVGLEVPLDRINDLSHSFFGEVTRICDSKKIKACPLVSSDVFDEFNISKLAVELSEGLMRRADAEYNLSCLLRRYNKVKDSHYSAPEEKRVLSNNAHILREALRLSASLPSSAIFESWSDNIRAYERSIAANLNEARPGVSFVGVKHLYALKILLPSSYKFLDLTKDEKIPFSSKRFF
jgi:hypothetical protein